MTYPPMRDYAETCRAFSWDLPSRFNFGADVVDRWAADPDKLALIWCDRDGAEARYTFAEIAALSDRLANVLAAEGIEKGDRVVIMLPRIPAWYIAMVGTLKLGAVVVPCIDMLTEGDLAYRIRHAGAKGIVTTTANVEKAAGADGLVARIAVGGASGWADYDAAMDAASADVQCAAVGLEDPAAIYFTSGTTGDPKGVTHASRALYVWRAQAQYWLDLGPDDRMWCTADTGWSKAGTSMLFGPWSMGAAVLLYDGPFEPAERLALLARHRITVFCAAATELRRLIYEDVAAHDLSALRHTVSAGEMLNPEVANKWSALTGRPTHEGYGQTETLMSVHNYPATPLRPGSMGLPLPGYTVAVLDGAGQALSAGDVGTLAVKLPNPNFMLGYWGEPERAAAQIVENAKGRWWLTGDTAQIDADGYVFFHGRADDIISSAGYRIGPGEVENAMLEHAAVRECAAVASPDPDRGEVVKVFVVLADGHAASDALVRELQDHCKRLTAPYKYPRRIAFVDDLPKNAAGKILRAVLKRREYEASGKARQ